MFNLFTFVNFGALECLRASKLPRALGKFFSLVRALFFSFVLTMQRYEKYLRLSKKYPKNSHFLRCIFRAKNAEK